MSQLPPPCAFCTRKPCTDLPDPQRLGCVRVLSNRFAAPAACPLLVRDSTGLNKLLFGLDGWALRRLASDANAAAGLPMGTAPAFPTETAPFLARLLDGGRIYLLGVLPGQEIPAHLVRSPAKPAPKKEVVEQIVEQIETAPPPKKEEKKVRTPIHIIEVPDVLFALGSAVPALDEEGWLVGAIATAVLYAKDEGAARQERLIVCGHADTTKNPEVNYRIAEQRAQMVKAILEQNAEGWKTLAAKYGRVRDYQRTLKSLAVAYGWSCDPGDVDNKYGPKTEAAVQAFQRECNERYNMGLTVDGDVGPKTWGAIHRTLCALLCEHLDIAGTATPAPPKWLKPVYGFPAGQGVYSCGESFPVDAVGRDDVASEENRRVELVFAPKDLEVKAAPSKSVNMTEKDCVLYDGGRVEWISIPLQDALLPDPFCILIAETSHESNSLAQGTAPGSDGLPNGIRQYVNLPSEKSGNEEGLDGCGSRRVFKVMPCDKDGKPLRTEDASLPETLRVKVTLLGYDESGTVSGTGRSPRNNPKPSLLNKYTWKEAPVAQEQDGVAYWTGILTVPAPQSGGVRGSANFAVELGLAGGDVCRIEVGPAGALARFKPYSTVHVVNWRRLEYNLAASSLLAQNKHPLLDVKPAPEEDANPEVTLHSDVLAEIDKLLKPLFVEYRQSESSVWNESTEILNNAPPTECNQEKPYYTVAPMAQRERISVLQSNSAAGLSNKYRARLAPHRVNLLLADLIIMFDMESIKPIKTTVDPKKMHAEGWANSLVLDKSYQDGGDALRVLDKDEKPLLWQTLVPTDLSKEKSKPKLSVALVPISDAQSGAGTLHIPGLHSGAPPRQVQQSWSLEPTKSLELLCEPPLLSAHSGDLRVRLAHAPGDADQAQAWALRLEQIFEEQAPLGVWHPAVDANGVARSGEMKREWLSLLRNTLVRVDLPAVQADSNMGHPGLLNTLGCSLSVEFVAHGVLRPAGFQLGKCMAMALSNEKSKTPADLALVLCHELGHAMGMTILEGHSNPSPGMETPKSVDEGGLYYSDKATEGKGKRNRGVGPHCAFGVSATDLTYAAFTQDKKLSGKCVMFDTTTGASSFCPQCQTLLRARNLSAIGLKWDTINHENS
jgi:hypothetical protein